jgi:heme/copper-type cytochrome/quinol oxidase subunit 2
MVTIWADTPAGRAIQLVGLVFVMMAIAEYADIIDFLPLNAYVIIVGVFVFLRWFVQRYHEREREHIRER